jgi:hypothetical protein
MEAKLVLMLQLLKLTIVIAATTALVIPAMAPATKDAKTTALLFFVIQNLKD